MTLSSAAQAMLDTVARAGRPVGVLAAKASLVPALASRLADSRDAEKRAAAVRYVDELRAFQGLLDRGLIEVVEVRPGGEPDLVVASEAGLVAASAGVAGGKPARRLSDL